MTPHARWMAVGAWIFAAIGAAAVVEASSIPRPHGVRTSIENGTEYLNANDILRALDGAREMQGELGMARLHIYGEELALLDGSRLVRGQGRSWALPEPVRFRGGQVWLPRAFLDVVVAELTSDPIGYEKNRLFVGFEPGIVEMVSVEPVFDGREVTIVGRFPVPPELTASRRRLVIQLPGCFGESEEFMGDDLVTGIAARETPGGVVLTIDVTDELTGYTWRERSTERLRLLFGDRQEGLVALDPQPGTAARRISRIVIDPARGGGDLGEQLGGVREKWLSLELARVVADSLLAAGYDVFLTRNEDRDLTPDERAETANEWGASLFLSLAFDTYPSEATPDVRCVVHRPVGGNGDDRVAAGYRLRPWSQTQRTHIVESLSLARWITRSAPGEPSGEPVRVPSRLLEGLDMPAVEILIAAGVAERGPWRFWRERFANGIVRAVLSYSGRSRNGRRAERSVRERGRIR